MLTIYKASNIVIITQNQEIVIDYADKLEMPIHDTSISYDEDYNWPNEDYSDDENYDSNEDYDSDEDVKFDYNFDEDYEDEDYSDEDCDSDDEDKNDEDDYQNEDNDEDKKDLYNNQYKGEDFDHNYEDEYYEDKNDEDDYQKEDNDEDYRQVGCHQNDEYNDAWSAFQSYLDKQEADILNFLQLPEDCIEDMKTVARENNLDWLTHLKEINLEFRPDYIDETMPLRPLVDEINEEAIIIEDQESYKKMLDDELTGIENDIKSWNEFLARKQFKNDYQLICEEEEIELTDKFWDEFHSDYKMTFTQEEENAREEFWKCMDENRPFNIYK